MGLNLIGLDRTAPIEAFLPVIVFASLFGLSMDDEVFLFSRIREEYVHGETPRGAITHGIAAIGRVVVAAATIMSTVFFSFLLGDSRIIKEFGIALGVAIVVDAFLVRLTLVPAIMYLLDDKAWYLPKWLDRSCLVSRSSLRVGSRTGAIDRGAEGRARSFTCSLKLEFYSPAVL
jgi:RND superfamily putative drug exporter